MKQINKLTEPDSDAIPITNFLMALTPGQTGCGPSLLHAAFLKNPQHGPFVRTTLASELWKNVCPLFATQQCRYLPDFHSLDWRCPSEMVGKSTRNKSSSKEER